MTQLKCMIPYFYSDILYLSKMYLVLYRRLPKNQVSLIVVLSVMYGGGFLSSQIFPQIENHQRHQRSGNASTKSYNFSLFINYYQC